MSKIQQKTVGLTPTLEFTADNNTVGEIGMDGDGFKFDGQVSQKQMISEVCAAEMEINARKGNAFSITLTEAVTDFDIINAGIGTYIFKFTQDATGGWAVTFDAKFKFEGGVAPSWGSNAASVVNVLSCFYDGTNFYCSVMLSLS